MVPRGAKNGALLLGWSGVQNSKPVEEKMAPKGRQQLPGSKAISRVQSDLLRSRRHQKDKGFQKERKTFKTSAVI